MLYATDDASVSAPAWIDATSRARGFSSSRGRESELTQIEAGTCTVRVDNRTREFDPVANSSIRPLNRWWIREQFSGETQDIFKGWAERIDQEWEATDAVAVITCSDEFKLLGLDSLPTTSPPRGSYSEVVESDLPTGYWPLNDPPEFRTQSAEIISPVEEPTPTPIDPGPPPALIRMPDFGDPWGWGWS